MHLPLTWNRHRQKIKQQLLFTCFTNVWALNVAKIHCESGRQILWAMQQIIFGSALWTGPLLGVKLVSWDRVKNHPGIRTGRPPSTLLLYSTFDHYNCLFAKVRFSQMSLYSKLAFASFVVCIWAFHLLPRPLKTLKKNTTILSKTLTGAHLHQLNSPQLESYKTCCTHESPFEQAAHQWSGGFWRSRELLQQNFSSHKFEFSGCS